METIALGFPVISREGDPLGRLVDVQGEWLILQSGFLFKIRRAAPKELAEVDEVEEEIHLRAASEAVRRSPVLAERDISQEAAALLRDHYERTTVFNFDGSS